MHVLYKRGCFLIGTAAVVGVAGAGAASAHVSANAPGAAQGGYSVISFRVPNESETAATTGLTVTLPTDAALKSVRTEPVAGWRSTVGRTADGTPTSVTWTAEPGTSIGADQFGQFDLSVGPLPETDSVAFDATQTYDDGSVVNWDEPPNADGSEPEHPAPQITLAGAAEGATDEDGDAPVADADTITEQAAAGSSSDTTARWLGPADCCSAPSAWVSAQEPPSARGGAEAWGVGWPSRQQR